MTITYSNGTVLKAIVLTHGEHEIRAIAAGSDDVLAFTWIHGTWITEEIEPVAIEFEWQRRGAPQVCSGVDCVCPKELAANLIQTLFAGFEGDKAGSDTLMHAIRKGPASPSTKLNHVSAKDGNGPSLLNRGPSTQVD